MLRILVSLSVLALTSAGCATGDAVAPRESGNASEAQSPQPITQADAQTCLAAADAADWLSEAVRPGEPLPADAGFREFWQNQLEGFVPVEKLAPSIRNEAIILVAPINQATNDSERQAAIQDLTVVFMGCVIQRNQFAEATNG